MNDISLSFDRRLGITFQYRCVHVDLRSSQWNMICGPEAGGLSFAPRASGWAEAANSRDKALEWVFVLDKLKPEVG